MEHFTAKKKKKKKHFKARNYIVEKNLATWAFH